MRIIREAKTGTAKCPTCGGKYLLATNYCVTCKKKVGKAEAAKKDEKVITEMERGLRDDFQDVANENFSGDYVKALESFVQFVVPADKNLFNKWSMNNYNKGL